MNKRPEKSVPNRIKDLEDELTGKVAMSQLDADTGKDTQKPGKSTTKLHNDALREYRQFAIKQGRRRRHPKTVLAQFDAITKTTSNAESAWERALMHEQERVEVPQEYQAKDADMIANQVGLVTTALDNYMKSQNKFDRYSLAGG